MSYFKAISFADKSSWENILKITESRMLETSYNFCQIFNNYLKNTTPEIFYFEEGLSKCTYTYLKSKTSIGDTFHIHSPYCYGGFSTNNNSEKFFSLFRENFVKYCEENKIISEFVRLNPITHNYTPYYKNYFDFYKKHCSNLYVNLIEGYSKPSRENHRRLVKAAQNNAKLEFVFNNKENFDIFYKIYNSNMESKKINNFFNFKEFFFKNLLNYIGDDFFFPTISLENKIIAGAIFLKNNDFFDLYLAASYPIAREIKGCNHLLFHEFLKKISTDYKNAKLVHLGGGSEELKYFKSGFAKENCDYFVIKNILNKKIYSKLLNCEEEKIDYENVFPDKKIYNYDLI